MRTRRFSLAVLCLAVVAVAALGQQPKLDAKAEKLRKADKDAMAAFRTGKKLEGGEILLKAAAPYKDVLPRDCTNEESLALAVLYVRLMFLGGKQTKEETTLTYFAAVKLHSERGGVKPDDFEDWLKKVGKETSAAINEKK
jgi:hypothetical protein